MRSTTYRGGLPHAETFFGQHFRPASAMVGCRRPTSRHRTAMAHTAAKIRSQFDVGVIHNHHERGSMAAVHVDTAAAVQMDWTD